MDMGIGLWCLQSTATNPRSFGQAYQELVEDARMAEDNGIRSLWLSEHHAYYDGYCPALMPAAAAALRNGGGIVCLQNLKEKAEFWLHIADAATCDQVVSAAKEARAATIAMLLSRDAAAAAITSPR